MYDNLCIHSYFWSPVNFFFFCTHYFIHLFHPEVLSVCLFIFDQNNDGKHNLSNQREQSRSHTLKPDEVGNLFFPSTLIST